MTVVSPERSEPLPHAHVVIRQKAILSVGVEAPGDATTGVTVIDGAGRYLVPGLIDGHVHLAGVPGMTEEQERTLPEVAAAYDRQLPRSYLYFGFTAVVDLNVLDRARLERFRAADPGPAIFDCGGGLALANGYPMAYLPPATRFDRFYNFLYDARQAGSIPKQYSQADHTPEANVARAVSDGAKCIKTYYESGFGELAGLPVPTLEMMRAVRDASHRRGVPLLLHANTLAAHRFAAAAGVDVVVHGMWNQDDDNAPGLTSPAREVLDAEIKAGVGMMPTSRIVSGLADVLSPAFLNDPHLSRVLLARLLAWYRSDEGQWFARSMSSQGPPGNGRREILRRVQHQGQQAAVYFVNQGGRLLFGSDTPSGPTYANPPGYNGYLELRELEAAGLSPRQLLRAATVENARLFGLTGYGTIEAGNIASLLLLREDPLASTAAIDAIDTVIVRGRVISRSALLAHE